LTANTEYTCPFAGGLLTQGREQLQIKTLTARPQCHGGKLMVKAEYDIVIAATTGSIIC
jgi:hypothetical protein